MTPGARAQAAIELLDAIITAAREGGAAADTLITRYFAERRYAGSKDRRAVRDLVYRAIRALGEVPVSGRAAMLAVLAAEERDALFIGEGHAPHPYRPGEPVAVPGVAPRWLIDRLRASGIGEADLAALVADRAPLDVRVNTLRTSADAIRALLGDTEGQAIDGLPDALRLPNGSDISALAGLVEVQDAGSQCVALASGARPGMSVVDLCAGGGGKTLALAAMMDNRGHILATDTNRDRLSRLAPRAAAAGVEIAETRLLNPGREVEMLADWQGRADIVVIDAPCSGTGTWRRNPEARWRLSPGELDRLAIVQARLLDVAARLVRPQGRITYIVCSLLDEEGPGRVEAFLGRHPQWRSAPVPPPLGRPHGLGWWLTPEQESTDGFFVATLAPS